MLGFTYFPYNEARHSFKFIIKANSATQIFVRITTNDAIKTNVIFLKAINLYSTLKTLI